VDDLLGHAILIIVYHLLSHDDEVYKDLGVQHLDESRRERVQRGLVQRLKDLGYQVTLDLLNLAHTPPDGGVGSFSQHI
jgi:hypothetical protein